MTNDEGRAAARLELKTLSKVGELLAKLGDENAVERVLRYHAERAELSIVRVGTFPIGLPSSPIEITSPLVEQVKRVADALEAIPHDEFGHLAVAVTGHINTTESAE